MKRIYLTFFVFLLLISSNNWAQSKSGSGYSFAANDSLLFDGEGNANFFDKVYDGCFVRVTYVHGKATGTRIKKYVLKTCGEPDTVTREEIGQIETNDKLVTGDIISTGPDSYMEIKFSDGKLIRFSPNTSVTINSDFCKSNSRKRVYLNDGQIFADDRPGSKDNSIDIFTKYGTAITEGTQFTCCTLINGSDTTDILKVYEGSVKFQMVFQNGSSKKTADMGAEMKRAFDDYQSGKITADEYGKKIQELQKGITDIMPKLPITVSAGFLSKITNAGNPIEPESIDASEVHWWEGPNFQ